jgi:hypothetical protein
MRNIAIAIVLALLVTLTLVDSFEHVMADSCIGSAHPGKSGTAHNGSGPGGGKAGIAGAGGVAGKPGAAGSSGAGRNTCGPGQ